MILSVDVDYRDTGAVVAGIAFRNWEDGTESGLYASTCTGFAAYLPGQFYRRELPCILKLLEEHALKPEIIVIDGYVYLDGCRVPGLGKHLHDALHGKVTVVGVAKRTFQGIPPDCALLRGKSRNPLYITSVGMPLETAKKSIRSMHGTFRVPDLLRKTDRACRQR